MFMGCAGQLPTTETASYATVFAVAEEQWTQNHETEEFVSFQTAWLEFNNSNRIDEQGNCYALSEQSEVIVLVQDAHGVIQDVVPRNANRKTACFAEVFLGQKYPAPPFAPFYHIMHMGP
jgi:hypothetical protein